MLGYLILHNIIFANLQRMSSLDHKINNASLQVTDDLCLFANSLSKVPSAAETSTAYPETTAQCTARSAFYLLQLLQLSILEIIGGWLCSALWVSHRQLKPATKITQLNFNFVILKTILVLVLTNNRPTYSYHIKVPSNMPETVSYYSFMETT